MFVRLKKSARTVNPVVQIVENMRVDGKVKQKVIASLGTANSPESFEQLERLARSLLEKLECEKRRQPSLFPDFVDETNHSTADDTVKLTNLEHEATICDGYALAVRKLFELAGFSAIAQKTQGRRKFDVTTILQLIIAQRFSLPASKLRTYLRQHDLGFSGIELKHVYRTMDAIFKYDDAFQKQAFHAAHGGLFEDPVECFFFDVTTLYFESVVQDEIRDFGFSKDQKFHQVQIVLCLVVNREGIPLAYETFKGNTAEITTLLPVMEKIRKRFAVEQVTVVCDRGMASRENIISLATNKFNYIVACKLKHLSSMLKLNDLSTFTELHMSGDDSVMYKRLDHPKYPDTDLIVTYSSRRAQKDKADRDRLIEKLTRQMTTKSSGNPVKKLISNSGYKKFVILKGAGVWQLNETAIEADASWDGFHGIAVAKSMVITTQDALAQYRGLWRVEEAFRVAKCTLKTRPIFHWRPNRIRAHILICFLNLFIERQLELILRRRGTPLTPDRIRYALSKMHQIRFCDRASKRTGTMEASLSADARTICAALGISTRRKTYFDS